MSTDSSGREFDFLVDDDPINTEVSAYNELATHVRRSDAELIKLRAENERLKRGRDRLIETQEELIEENKRLTSAVCTNPIIQAAQTRE